MDEWLEKQEKAKGIAVYCMGQSARSKYGGLDTVVEIMDRIRDEYSPKGAASLELLYEKLLGYQLASFDNIQMYASAIRQADEEIKLSLRHFL